MRKSHCYKFLVLDGRVQQSVWLYFAVTLSRTLVGSIESSKDRSQRRLAKAEHSDVPKVA